MRATRMIGRLAAILTVVPALVVGTGVAAHADGITVQTVLVDTDTSTMSVRPRHATFQGPLARDRKSGQAGDNPTTLRVENGTCTELSAHSGLECSLSWKLNKVDICRVDPNLGEVGIASYTNALGQTVDVALRGIGDAGSGVLEGVLPMQDGTTVFQVHIDASDVCGAMLLLSSVSVTTLDGDLTGAATQIQAGEFTGWVDWT